MGLAFIETYFKKYPAAGRYITETKQFAAEHGYLTTLYRRRRDFFRLEDFASRTAAADYRARGHKLTHPRKCSRHNEASNDQFTLGTAGAGLKTRILLQVHVGLVLEAPEGEVDQVARLTREVMSTAFALNVPLVVDVETV
jgi:DNA polymerase-1